MIVIKRSYWMLVAVVFVAGLLGATVGGGTIQTVDISGIFDTDSAFDDSSVQPEVDADTWMPDTQTDDPWEDYDDNYDPNPDNWFDDFTNGWGEAARTIIAIVLLLVIFAIIIGIFFSIFVSNVVTAGVNGWLMRYWRGVTPPFGDLFATFRTYASVVKTMFLRGLYTFLWSLLFVIPGIIKDLAYSMVPYIISENPNLTSGQALKISIKMTDGYKGDLFVLGLSFIGWNMLSALTGGILGVLYVNPYIGLTYAGMYDQLKWNAIQDGRLTWADFGQSYPTYEQPTYEQPVAPENYYG